MKAIKRTEASVHPVKRDFMEVGEAHLKINLLFLLINLFLKERKIKQFMLYL
ncbi:hypothetical protein [Bacillus pumilus]|uniref:hypothetical protein n=1 Tax=Bacillus pumilus TaxID=1408 RepID=UPI003CEAD12F